MNPAVHCVLDTKSTLGEGPLWHAPSRRLYWVDIPEGLLHSAAPDGGGHRTFPMGESVSAVAASRDGSLLLGLENGVAAFDPATGARTMKAGIETDNPDTRLNDGKCGPDGRLWIGTMSKTRKPCAGSLYRVDRDGSVEPVIRNVSISNGLAWTSDEKTMYFIDTPTQKVVAYAFDAERGRLANPVPAVEVPEAMGRPDGMTIDEEGMLWIALFAGGCVARWDPRTGSLLERVEIPSKNVTSCAFGGDDLKSLYVTTARTHTTEEELERLPRSGGLFRVDLDVGGPPAFDFVPAA